MTYTISSVYRNKSKIHFAGDDKPLVDHEISERYDDVDESMVEAVVAEMMDVIPNKESPEINSKNANFDIPESIKSEILENYRKRYSDFSKFMGSLRAELFVNGEKKELDFEFSEEHKYGGDGANVVHSKVIVKKNS